MNKCAKFLAAAVLVSGFSAQAQWLVRGALSFDMLTNDQSTPALAADKKSEDIKFLTLTGGYVIQNTYYVGAIYEMKNKELDDDGTVTSSDLNQMGLSAGYIMGNWSFNLNYFLSAKNDSKVGANTYDYSDGSGFGIDVTYGLELMPGLRGGLQLVYRSLTYDTLDSSTDALDGDTDLKVSETAPAVFLAWSI